MPFRSAKKLFGSGYTAAVRKAVDFEIGDLFTAKKCNSNVKFETIMSEVRVSAEITARKFYLMLRIVAF